MRTQWAPGPQSGPVSAGVRPVDERAEARSFAEGVRRFVAGFPPISARGRRWPPTVRRPPARGPYTGRTRETATAWSALARRIRLLVAAAITYNAIEAIVAITAGTITSSTALIGFGLDSVIEVSSAAAVAWHALRALAPPDTA